MEEILAGVLDRRQEKAEDRRLRISELNKKVADAQQGLARLYAAIERGTADIDDPDLAARIVTLKALRDQAMAESDKAVSQLEASGSNAITPDVLATLARRTRKRLRGENGKYRCDHLHQFAQRVEVQGRRVRIGGTTDALLNGVMRTGGEQPETLVPSAVLKWLPG